jgi:hypothetical protein
VECADKKQLEAFAGLPPTHWDSTLLAGQKDVDMILTWFGLTPGKTRRELGRISHTGAFFEGRCGVRSIQLNSSRKTSIVLDQTGRQPSILKAFLAGRERKRPTPGEANGGIVKK